MRGPVQSLDISYLLHATEDPGKLKAAVTRMIGSDPPVETEEMSGHFGNRIVKVELHLHGDEAASALQALASNLPKAVRAALARDMDQYLDEHSSLFVRLDKQKLVRGEFAIGTNDVVRIKVKPRAFVLKGRTREFFAGLLGEG